MRAASELMKLAFEPVIENDEEITMSDSVAPCEAQSSLLPKRNATDDDSVTDQVAEWTRYADLFEDTALDEAQKQHLVEALWSIVILLWGAGYSEPITSKADDDH